MRIVNNDNYAFGFIIGYVNFPKHSVSLVAKKTWKYDLAGNLTELEDGPVLEGDVECKGEVATSAYDADLAIYKPNAEVMLTGTCFVPNGESKTVFDCAFKVGEWSKVLAVIGNRTWIKKLLGSKMSDPEPFTKVELSWSHAFGGKKIAANPAGTGFKQGMLPNIEYANSLMKGAGDKPSPACFAPIHRQWKARAGKMGTYDKKWLKERWPAQAADFDWSYYSAASPDQQIEGFLRGDESIELVHMHAEQARINFKLPGRMPRVLFRNVEDETVVDLPMNLDTFFVDTENMLVHAVWRGVCNIADDEWSECDVIVIADDSVSERGAAESFYPLFVEEEDEEEPETEDEQQHQTVEEIQADMDAQFKAADEAIKKQTDSFLQRAREQFPQHFNPAMLEGGQPADFSKVPDMLRAAIQKASATGATIPSALGRVADGLESDLAKVNVGDDGEKPASHLAVIKSGEASGGDFTDADLKGQDLSGVELRDVNFTNADLSGADLSGADLTGAIFEGTNLKSANLELAKLNDTSFSNTNLRSVNFNKAELADVVIQNCDASQAVFTEVKLNDGQLSGLQADGTDWTGARLSSANVSDCSFKTAVFESANLESASLTNCVLTEAVFDKSQMASISISGDADATGLSARDIEAAESSWDKLALANADFVRADLTSAQFTGCNLEGANLSAAQLPTSNLMKCNLKNAKLVGTNLFESMLSKADLTGANLMAANLYQADLFDAVTEGADLNDAIIKGTLLAK